MADMKESIKLLTAKEEMARAETEAVRSVVLFIFRSQMLFNILNARLLSSKQEYSNVY